MNSVTAVLLALVLIVAILLVVWLVLRSGSSDRTPAMPSGPGAESNGTAASLTDRMSGEPPVGPGGSDPRTAAARPEATSGTEPTTHAQRDSDALDGATTPGAGRMDEGGGAAAQEFVDPGLSEMDSGTGEEGEGDPVLSGAPPRTPTEAFGSAASSGDVSGHEAASLETSVLDEQDVDSTPLFRSIREELKGSAASGQPDQSEGEPVEGLANAVAEQPEVERTWSDERRGWDEQAHADAADASGASPDTTAEAIEAQENAWSETVTEGVVETGAVGAGSVGPAAEEEELLESNEDTALDVIEPGSGVVAGEHPQAVRISELHEVVDGGFGIGSAATIAGGAQPLGHPIKANVDTKTYQDLHSPWYDETEPDVWFLDAGFAERAGFRRAE